MQNLGRPIGTFLAAILVLIPVPWNWRACNVGHLRLQSQGPFCSLPIALSTREASWRKITASLKHEHGESESGFNRGSNWMPIPNS
ncbi:hypothetical protein V8E55_009433 [Tylopilus felleus]